MYDWPEERAGTEAFFAQFAQRTDLEGKIELIRPETSAETDALWRDPKLLLGQTCWGPMEAGLKAHVQVLAQPDYSAFEGGEGAFYRSALVAKGQGSARFAFNATGSLSGYIAPDQDIEHGLRGAFSQLIETGSHRASVLAVAENRADLAAIDCRSWAMAKTHEPAAKTLRVTGWTQPRPGLPYICAKDITPATVQIARAALLQMGALAPLDAAT